MRHSPSFTFAFFYRTACSVHACAYFIFSSWSNLGCAVKNRGRPRCCAAQPSTKKGGPLAALILMASRSGLNLGASVRSAAGGAYSGLCTQGQGETSVYCTARSSKKEGEQTLDGAHLRLARPTFPLGLLSKFRLAGRARLFRGPTLSTA